VRATSNQIRLDEHTVFPYTSAVGTREGWPYLTHGLAAQKVSSFLRRSQHTSPPLSLLEAIPHTKPPPPLGLHHIPNEQMRRDFA